MTKTGMMKRQAQGQDRVDLSEGPDRASAPSRRTLIKAIGVGAGALAVGGRAALTQEVNGPVSPPSTVTDPPRDFGPEGAPTTYFWDPDVIAVDPSFRGLTQPNSAIQRLWTGALWAEGPAWSSQGRYLVWSDIPNNRQMRWLEEDGHVSVFRAPSQNSNGNTFDFQGRQISCQHLMRRVVRYELDGSAIVLADSFEGKRLNSPNDAVPHPDGSLWFTDPPYGGMLYEGAPDAAGGPTNPAGLLNPTLGQPPGIGAWKRELPTHATDGIPAASSRGSPPKTRCPTPTASAFRPSTRRSTSQVRARGPAIPDPAARVRSLPSTSAPTTSLATIASSPTVWSTA